MILKVERVKEDSKFVWVSILVDMRMFIVDDRWKIIDASINYARSHYLKIIDRHWEPMVPDMSNPLNLRGRLTCKCVRPSVGYRGLLNL